MRFEMFGVGPAIKRNVSVAIKSKVNFVAIEYIDDNVVRTAMNAYDPHWGHVCVTIWEGPES
jgi:N-acetylglutamate synthase/N-acetylornithine aminotransferase